ncbi:hypothetical protein BT63DRAFT_415503 [Microthyrium microscopicum]|uniref:BTB domain-containing protein n=1 Tax=Microthyrium microscopicum TaxID=703497 RepID=A0A6A6UAR0_9PEZI|nr:hypothetical protein BT63DRAFT_415503 [Microthyrium microscopicum]
MSKFQGPMVQIIVHAEFLTTDSEYCRSMLKNDFDESIEGAIGIPNQRPATFDLYLNYVYRGTRDLSITENTSQQGEVLDKETKKSKADERHSLLFDAIGLADYLQSDNFHNASINALMESVLASGFYPVGTTDVVRAVELGVPEIIELLQDFIVHDGQTYWIPKSRGQRASGDFKFLEEHP